MLTRRGLLAGAGVLAGAGALGVIGRAERARAAGATMPLPVPALMDARLSGGVLSLVAAAGRHRFAPDLPAVATYGYSAPCLGPVLRLRRGDAVKVSVENRLDVPTTAHWHGLLVPAEVDGGPHHPISPGATWRPRLEVDQAEATCWYHAHPHGDTGRQVYMGLAGMMIIEDGTGAELGLPQSYGVDDLPLILQDRLFSRKGELEFRNFARERILGTRGDTLVVNGAISPTARVPAARVRLRLLNGANARNFHLGFDDGRAFNVIASDGGYLPAPVPMQALTISPGERFEIVVDFSDGRDAVLATTGDPVTGEAGSNGLGVLTGRGPTGTPTNGPGALVTFRVDPSLAAPPSRLPDRLVPIAAPDASRAVERRTVTLDMWPGQGGRVGAAGGGSIGLPRAPRVPGSGPAMGMNGQFHDMHRIDFAPKLGSSEIWEVFPVLMPHPFHVHGVFFRVLSIGGAPPPDHLAAEKDTVLLGQPAELLLRFNQHATEAHPFMVHCHILDHEDGGLMGQYMTT
ncbi:multicopper oxidase domain-containing protein [Phaeovulum sp.]|uniref:multicopper oxidase domain-containing protein n=1 Tax=Phaeovulum sp. TaxID=2934796 RepID=UPI00272EF3A3|nr:multicopper oxidase domain-containing protein [Phaeovulum sp.]MDP1667568.1 multicopper oxidase domain-containing protein [Phaeovulum sp.]MDZ4120085.1 multicopper oxidase domain-containing protein [Phaeovulum sp.]